MKIWKVILHDLNYSVTKYSHIIELKSFSYLGHNHFRPLSWGRDGSKGRSCSPLSNSCEYFGNLICSLMVQCMSFVEEHLLKVFIPHKKVSQKWHIKSFHSWKMRKEIGVVYFSPQAEAPHQFPYFSDLHISCSKRSVHILQSHFLEHASASNCAKLCVPTVILQHVSCLFQMLPLSPAQVAWVLVYQTWVVPRMRCLPWLILYHHWGDIVEGVWVVATVSFQIGVIPFSPPLSGFQLWHQLSLIVSNRHQTKNKGKMNKGKKAYQNLVYATVLFFLSGWDRISMCSCDFYGFFSHFTGENMSLWD